MVFQDRFDFILLFSMYKVRWGLEIVGTVFCCLLICGEERGMEDKVDLPPGRNVGVECSVGDHFLNFKWPSALQ